MIVVIAFSRLSRTVIAWTGHLQKAIKAFIMTASHDLEYRLYEAMCPIFIPLQFLRQVITLPVTAEALWRMGYDSEVATTICSTSGGFLGFY